MDEILRRWIGMSEQDYQVAKHLFESFYPKPLEIICYHCQQSAEKALNHAEIILGWGGNILEEF